MALNNIALVQRSIVSYFTQTKSDDIKENKINLSKRPMFYLHGQLDRNVSYENGLPTIRVLDSENSDNDSVNGSTSPKRNASVIEKEDESPSKMQKTTTSNRTKCEKITKISHKTVKKCLHPAESNKVQLGKAQSSKPGELDVKPLISSSLINNSNNYSSANSTFNLSDYGIKREDLEYSYLSEEVLNVSKDQCDKSKTSLNDLNASKCKKRFRFKSKSKSTANVSASNELVINTHHSNQDNSELKLDEENLYKQPAPEISSTFNNNVDTNAFKMKEEVVEELNINNEEVSEQWEQTDVQPLHYKSNEVDLDETIICDDHLRDSKSETAISEPEKFSFVRDTVQYIWSEFTNCPSLNRLIAPDDHELLWTLFNLSNSHQEFCLRLYTRQEKWYQVRKFMADIKLNMGNSEIEDMLQLLDGLGFISQDYHNTEPLDTLLNLLPISDVKAIGKKFRMRNLPNYKKQTLIEALIKHTEIYQVTLSGGRMYDVVMTAVATHLGKCIKLTSKLRRILFHFQHAFHFVLDDITVHNDLYLYVSEVRTGKIVLPNYTVNHQEIFTNWKDFYSYSDAKQLYFEYESLKERNTKTKIKDKLHSIAKKAYNILVKQSTCFDEAKRGKFTPGYVYAKILTNAAVDLTKENRDVTLWLRFLLNHNYCPSKRGDWYVHLAMHLERYDKNIPQAIHICLRGLNDNLVNVINKYNLSMRLQSLKQRKKFMDDVIPLEFPNVNRITTKCISAKRIDVKNSLGNRICYEENSAVYSVEEIARNHYVEHGFPKGIHCEGGLVMSLYVILFWDIIYSYVPGSFVSKLQYYPLDMYSKEFYLKRKAAIDKRLTDIEDGWDDIVFFDVMSTWYENHRHEKSLHSTMWTNDLNIILESATCLTRPKLAQLLKRLIENFRLYQAGMPDLFLWNPTSGKCMFVEVKSQNDTLSMKQKAWLCFLNDIGLQAEVCLVKNIGTRNRKTKVT